MRELPENKFGYLLLGVAVDEDRIGVLVKANKINSLSHDIDSAVNATIVNLVGQDDAIHVMDTIDEILEQLENIHPNLR